MPDRQLRVLALIRYSSLQPSSEFRFYQFLTPLRELGVSCTVSTLLGEWYAQDLFAGRPRRLRRVARAYASRLWSLLQSFRYDVIWLEGELWPRLPAWGETILALAGRPYVVDYDDSIFHRYDLHPNGLYRALLGRKIDTVMRRATVVVAANDYVAQRARAAGARRVEYIPDTVDVAEFRAVPPINHPSVVIGWIGTRTSAAYLPRIASALEDVSRSTNARLVLVGSGPVDLGTTPVTVHAWSKATEVAAIQGFDLGIMPLPDDPVTRGKSGLKLIQYMACGRPCVASPVGINRRIVRHGETGFLADTNADWVRCLTTLVGDRDLRLRMGAAARTEVEKTYSLEVASERLAGVLADAARANLVPRRVSRHQEDGS